MSVQTAVRLPDELHARLKALADQTGRSVAFYMRAAIEEHLEDIEDIYQADKVVDDLRAGRERTWPMAEVMAQHGLDH